MNMNLLLVGINHRTAPVEVRERMNIQESRLAAAVSDLAHREGILEGMIMSTCNRVELVTNAQLTDICESAFLTFLAEYHHCELAAFEPHFYWLRQRDAVRHLFRVASSLDSMILGEPQVLGQVKEAYATARKVGALNGVLGEIVSHSLAVARRVRRETAIGSSAVSVSYAAVELAKKIFGSLRGKTILVIGAGKMSELAAKHLLASGASAIFVSNRTYERAQELARAFHGTAVRFDELFGAISRADVVISSTGAPHFVITKDLAQKLLAARRNRPILLVDIAVPRDIEPAVNELDNAFVYDIDDLEAVVEANRRERQREAAQAEKIIEEELVRLERRLSTRELAPTIVAIEEHLNRIRESEFERFSGRLSSLTPDQRQAVEALARGIQNKILRGPLLELKGGADRPEHGNIVRLMRRIFGVGE